jgi:predicted RND superfamily exporter protein
MTNIFFFVLNHPKKVLFCIALVTYLFALSIVNLKYDFTIEQLFAKDKEETEVYFEFQKDFSREDNVFLLVHQVPGKISYSFIDSLSQIASALNKSSYFIEVISLADIYNDSNKREHDYISSKLLNMVSKVSTHGSTKRRL